MEGSNELFLQVAPGGSRPLSTRGPDRPAARLSKEDVDEMRGEPNIDATGKRPGLLPFVVGMKGILTESLLPPRNVRGAPGKVVGIERHAMVPSAVEPYSLDTQ